MKTKVEEKNKEQTTKIIQKNKIHGYGLDKYYEEERLERLKKEKIDNKNKKIKKTKKQIFIIILKIIIIFILLLALGIFLFFKTKLFEPWKELWVQTAMTTMHHKYLATWFLSDEEINEIMAKLEVKNDENSDSKEVKVQKVEKDEIKLEKIYGKSYVGYVLTIPDASKVKLIDTRKKNTGTKLSQIMKEQDAVAGINAGGFVDVNGVGLGNEFSMACIMNKVLYKGSKSQRYSFIGLTKDHKLALGKYTYYEAMAEKIENAVEFGPYLIVNGKNQIKNSNSGGIHPRTAIGQKKDGTFVFLVIDGRQPRL